MTYIILSLITYVVLLFNKNITIDICDSLLLPNKDNHGKNSLLFGFLFPVTIILLLKTKQMKSLKSILIWSVIMLLSYSVIQNFTSSYNQSVDIKGSFDNNFSKRAVVFDKMKKMVSEKLQVAGINDTSYYKNLIPITDGRKDGPQLMWKWTQENNPNINFSEVSGLYYDLSSTISGLRQELQVAEALLQADVRSWYLLHNKFPTNIYLFYQSNNLQYIPILSDLSRKTNETGVDNEYKIK